MIELNKAISFNTFFLLEFMKQVIQRLGNDFDPKAIDFLKRFRQSILQAEDPIEVLEDLARFPQTNEMTIFLFDMLNRLEKIPPQNAVENLEDLATDFFNLFTLLIEDKEVLEGLQEISANFAPLAAEEPQPDTPTEEEPLLSFAQFYPSFFKEQILQEFTNQEKEEMAQVLEAIHRELYQTNLWPPELENIVSLLKLALPANLEKADLHDLMDHCKERILQLADEFRQLKENSPSLFSSILKTGTVPVKEEKGEETIDNLLKAYFYSEVDDHVALLEDLLKKKLTPDTLAQLIKNLRSLKELSMIHGYNGVEFFCDNVIKQLRQKQESILNVGDPVKPVLAEMLEVLKDVERFESGQSAEEQREAVEAFEQKLQTVLEQQPVTPQEEPAEPEENVEPETTEPLIALEDESQIFQIFKDLVEKLTQRLQPFTAERQEQLFIDALNSLQQTSSWIDPSLPEEFVKPFKAQYQAALTLNDPQPVLQELEKIWSAFVQQIGAAGDFKSVIAQLQALEQEEAFALDAAKTQQALAEALKLSWQKVKPEMNKAWVEGDEQAVEQMQRFLHQLDDNLRLMALDGYLPFVQFLQQALSEQKLAAKPELVEELNRALELFLDRVQQKGGEGTADDLVETLQELFVAPEAEESAAPQAEISEDEKDFVEDSLLHLQNARNVLKQLETQPSQRELFKEIATEVHAIYSGAQFLGRERTADASLVVEETAEMFSDPAVELPDDLFVALNGALEALEHLVNDPQAEIEQPFEALQSILDRLVLEEQVEVSESEEAEAPTSEVPEKPLFSPEVTDEEEIKEIFKEDAQALLRDLQKANAALIENPTDEAAIYEMDQAIHALKNAARMTRQDDLSIVFGRLEEISEEFKSNPGANSQDIQKELKKVIDELQPIVLKGQIDSDELDSLLLKLDTIFNQVLSERKSEDERALRLKELFLEEARELVEKINNDLLELEKVPESSTVLADLLRHLHTLKGGAMMANFNKIGEVAHKLEDYFQLYRAQNAETKVELLPTAFTMIDLISEMLRAIELGKPETVSNFTARLADMDNKLFFLKDFEIPKETLEQIPALKPKSSEPVAVQESDNTLKVKTSYLDHLINLATEMLISRTELNSYFDKLKNLFYELDNRKKDLRGFAHQLEDFVEERSFNDLKGMMPSAGEDLDTLRNFSETIKSIAGDYYKTTGAMNKIIRFLERHISQLSVLSKSLHNDLLKARMVPVSTLFERFKRPVRDLARELKKQVELVIEDNDAEMDRAMVDALYEPLLHIVRNAVDHGLEKSSERKKAGKEPTGKIILRARQEKNQVVIDVVDDGRGIDLEKIREKIVKMKLATKKEAAAMSENRLLEYIFLPNFSTRGRATKTSGRGIGLDVVAMEIQKLKGIIRVKTTPGQGTVFSLRVPLTLIVSHAMLIKFHDISLAVPLLAVMESIKITEKDILVDDQRKYIQVRGKLLPYVDLDDILKFPDEEETKPTPKNIAIVLHDSGVSIALGVEKIMGRQDIIIKNLGNLLQNVDLISGGTILPDGEVALILDYAGIIHRVEADYFGTTRERVLVRKVLPKVKEKSKSTKSKKPTATEITVKKVTGRKPRILVVDDSASVRAFVSTFLKKHGFETLEATDGEEALQLAQETEVDLLITDLQMPKMNGFKLSEQLRAMEQYKDLPIIILTAQVGKKQEQKSEAVGANAFISKPFKEDDLIRMVKTFVQVE